VTAGRVDLYIEQGATYRRTWRWNTVSPDGLTLTPINLTGYIARMQIRRSQGATASVSISTESGGITLGGTAGTVSIVLTDDQTDVLQPKSAVYDLELEAPNGDVYRFIQGRITVDPNITQESDDPILTD